MSSPVKEENSAAENGNTIKGTSQSDFDTSSLTENGRNLAKIFCERCSSLVLLPLKANLVKKEFELPHMRKKNEASEGPTELLSDFWVVDNMYTFENLGFSNTVDNIKYLICADCEIGPIGWHDINDQKAFYIAVKRVQNGDNY